MSVLQQDSFQQKIFARKLGKLLLLMQDTSSVHKVSTQKKITGLFGNFSQHGGGVFPIPKTQNQKKVPLNHPKIT